MLAIGLVWCFSVARNLYLELQHEVVEESVPMMSRENQLQFLEMKRRVQFPALNTSLSPFPEFYEVLDSENWPLERYPWLPYNQNVSCVPKKFGYTQEQADKLFDPNRKFIPCSSFTKEFIAIQNNSLVLDCDDSLNGQYMLGTRPDEELLGQVNFRLEWSNYLGPVPLEDIEFAFGRCSRTRKQPIYINKFKPEASKRALNLTQSIASSLHMQTSPRPLSVFMVLFDSVSRQHFYRNFPQTIEYLNSELGEGGGFSSEFAMYDFVINNAHGENTQPNMVPLLYGYKLDHHKMRISGYDYKSVGDWWKFYELQEEALWKHYERMGFVTIFGFDTVWDFLSRCTGRKVKADHVATNFWHAARKVHGYLDFVERQRCLGKHHSHFYMLDYSRQFLQNYQGHNRFGYVHLSPGHEGSGTVIRTADPDVKNFFEEILTYYKNNPQEDFVIMLSSDHGKHSREWDKYIEGYLENQLPMHLMISNKDFIYRLGPQTDSILKHNTKRLVSRLDWHLTFRHLATTPYGLLSKNSSLYSAWKHYTDSSKAISLLLEKVPDNRSCEDVDIPSFLCTCQSFVSIPVEQAIKEKPIKHLVKLGLQYINESIKTEKNKNICKNITFNQLLEAEYKILKDDSKGNRNYRIRVSIKEDSNAVFEFYGLMAKEKEMEDHIKTDSAGVTFPTKKFKFGEFLSEKAMIQVQKVIRVDSYGGICEETAKVIGISGSICVCEKPSEKNLKSNTEMQEITEKLLDKLKLTLGSKGKACEEVCSEKVLNCLDWGFDLISAKEVLEQPWKPKSSIEVNLGIKGKLSVSEVEFSNSKSNTLSLQEKQNKFILNWNSKSNCTLVPQVEMPICPCSN